MKITGTIHHPILEIQNRNDDLRIIAYASDIFNKSGHFSRTRRLIFRNVSNTIADIELSIKKPFQVDCVRTCGAVKEENNVTRAVVPPRACVEVNTCC